MRALLRNGLFTAAAGISMLLAATPAFASSQGHFDGGVYVAPGALFTLFPATPHALAIERAEDFNAAVLGFIREAAATPAA